MVAASGLAVGVFAGLIVVRGTGKAAADAGKQDAAPVGAAQPTSGAAAGSESASDPAPAATWTTTEQVAVVSFSVRPRRAHIFVNGSELAGTSTDIPLLGGSARIQVTIRSRGHETHSKTYVVTGDQRIEVALRREHRDEPTGPGAPLDLR